MASGGDSVRKIGMGIVIGIVILTFWFSSKPNDDSHVQSDGLLLNLKIVTQDDIDHKTDKYLFFDLLIRKSAHFTLYLLLGVGGYLVTGSIKKTVVLVFIFAGLDEFHQHFSPGRTGHLQDVLIDSVGGAVGAGVTKLALTGPIGHPLPPKARGKNKSN